MLPIHCVVLLIENDTKLKSLSPFIALNWDKHLTHAYFNPNSVIISDIFPFFRRESLLEAIDEHQVLIIEGETGSVSYTHLTLPTTPYV